MKALLERKRKTYESLLTITEDMNRLAEEDDYDTISQELSGRRDEIIIEIITIDKEISEKGLNLSLVDKRKIMEMIVLVRRIDDVNNRLTEKVGKRKDIVAGEISNLDRTAEAVSKYVNCRGDYLSISTLSLS